MQVLPERQRIGCLSRAWLAVIAVEEQPGFEPEAGDQATDQRVLGIDLLRNYHHRLVSFMQVDEMDGPGPAPPEL